MAFPPTPPPIIPKEEIDKVSHISNDLHLLYNLLAKKLSQQDIITLTIDVAEMALKTLLEIEDYILRNVGGTNFRDDESFRGKSISDFVRTRVKELREGLI